MTKIRIMSEILANKIAAGEVVEKVSSVVKELVENSIDAEATSIIVELENGGLNQIRVVDDGIGMSHDDALLCFQRHATSKIYNDDDLFFINTLGFRGEAIPSISAVSEFDLKTCSGEAGTHIVYKGGKLITDEVSAAIKGTIITVKNLFYNTPARLKYLKSSSTELSYVVSLMEKLALANPKISFTLINDGKNILKTTGSGDLLKAINEIYGSNVASKMIKINYSNDDFDLFGYICKPEILKNNRNHIITFVNNRLVKNYDLMKAINDAYYMHKPEGKFPIVILNINTDPTLIDVNIHPTKQDIKVGKLNDLLTILNESITKALSSNNLINDGILKEEETPDLFDEEREVSSNVIKESEIAYNIPIVNNEEQIKFDLASEDVNLITENESIKTLELNPIGVIHKTYIICENEDGMYIVDQHAAHERINYEKVLASFKEKEVLKTMMLIPITIELTASEFLEVKENFSYIRSLGFDIDEFGINTISISAHPNWLTEGYEEETIRKMIEVVASEKRHFNLSEFNDRLAASMACKMSIKANMDISYDVQVALLKELVLCENPYNCAHGRPTIIKYSNYDLDKMFKRVMN